MPFFPNHKKISAFVEHQKNPLERMGGAKARSAEHEFITRFGHKPKPDELSAFVLKQGGVRPRA